MSAKLTFHGLLGAWICATLDATDEEVVAAAQNSGPPVVSDALILDRCYGGFRCAEDDGKRHIYVALGDYTYTGENKRASKTSRRKNWKELIALNDGTGGRFIGGGPCTADAPPQRSTPT